MQLDANRVDLTQRRVSVHVHPDLGALLPVHRRLGCPLLQEEGRADQGERHRDGQHGGHRHQAVSPEVDGGDKNVKLTAQHVYVDTGQRATEEFLMKHLAPLKREWLSRIQYMMADTI